LTAIPFALLVGPALGYYIGAAVDNRWRSSPWGTTVGVILGLAASGRVVAQFIKRSQDLDRDA
jgi:F0F1-type ATP synthase assembly protein I